MFVINNIKENLEESVDKKKYSPLDFIGYLTNNKTKWELLNEEQKHQFQPFIILKWLSMSNELTPYISLIIRYTIGVLDKQQIYIMLYYLLPKKKYYFNYIKKNKTLKYSDEIINIFVKEFELSKRECIQYIDFYKTNTKYITKLLYNNGLNDKEVSKYLKELK